MLILDEPTASLDPELRGELVEGVAAVARHTALPILYITHMGEEALRLAPKALYVEKGRIVEYDDTEAVLTRHGYVREAPWIRWTALSDYAHAAGGPDESRALCGDRRAARTLYGALEDAPLACGPLHRDAPAHLSAGGPGLPSPPLSRDQRARGVGPAQRLRNPHRLFADGGDARRLHRGTSARDPAREGSLRVEDAPRPRVRGARLRLRRR